jgi:glycosyltransferase involved in cell wall biosynthesis
MVLCNRSPLVTVVVPTYNRPKRLQKAIDSIRNQNYRPLEIIAVDDHSSNQYAADLAAEIDQDDITIRVHRHSENKGASAARNTGINTANGDYIAFLDDDDEWMSEKIERQVSELENTESDIASCWIQRVGPDGRHRASHTPEIDGDIIERLLLGNVTGTTSSVIIKTDLCRYIGGFDTSLPRWNDWDFALRATKYGDMVIVPEVLVRQYNWDGPQLSDDLDKLLTAKDHLLSKHTDLASEYGMKSEFVSRVNFGVGYSAGMSGEYAMARRSMLKAIQTYPYRPEFYVYFLAFFGGKFTLRPAQVSRRIFSRFRSKLVAGFR